MTGLKPWTTYEVAVAGYNNAGLGNPKILAVTTLDSSKYTWHVDRTIYAKMAGYQLTSFVCLGTRQRRRPLKRKTKRGLCLAGLSQPRPQGAFPKAREKRPGNEVGTEFVVQWIAYAERPSWLK